MSLKTWIDYSSLKSNEKISSQTLSLNLNAPVILFKVQISWLLSKLASNIQMAFKNLPSHERFKLNCTCYEKWGKDEKSSSLRIPRAIRILYTSIIRRGFAQTGSAHFSGGTIHKTHKGGVSYFYQPSFRVVHSIYTEHPEWARRCARQ